MKTFAKFTGTAARSLATLALLVANGVAIAAATPTREFLWEDSAMTIPLRERQTKWNAAGSKHVVYVDECEIKNVTFDEVERHTRTYDDVAAVIKALAPGPAAAALCTPKAKAYEYTTKYRRANLRVAAIVDENGKDTEKEVRTVVTGDTEHLYLGVDLPVTNRKTLKYDDSSKSLLPQDENPQVYLSLDWLIGDIADKPENVHAWQSLSFKAMFLVDSRPLDSMGLGIGYRLPSFGALGIDLSDLHLFAGHFWTKQDAIEGGSPAINGSTKRAWRFGVTYDISTGLNWLKH